MKPLEQRIRGYLSGLPPRATAEQGMLTLQTALETEDRLVLESLRDVDPEKCAARQAELKRIQVDREIVRAFAIVLGGYPLPKPADIPVRLPDAS